MSKITVLLLILLLFLQVYDVAISHLMGIELEANPVAKYLWATCGLGVLVVMKIGSWFAVVLLAMVVEGSGYPIWVKMLCGGVLFVSVALLVLVCINNTLWVLAK